VAIRIDGKAFHTFTRGFAKPFDEPLGNAMARTMEYLCKNIQGCVFGYTQSDEITLILIDYQTFETDAWFDYEVQKMCSIAASMATVAFNRFFIEEVEKYCSNEYLNCSGFNDVNQIYSLEELRAADPVLYAYNTAIEKGAMFDARCFNIPKEEACNLIYWRQLDATRNSIQMVGQAYFSHNELQHKSNSNIQDMLMEEYQINWNDYPTHLKRGSCCIKKPLNEYVKVVSTDKWGKSESVLGVREYGWVIDLEIPIFKGKDREYIERYIYFEEE
jgi:tRNA(His) 5'-end guanylyltransferase